MPAVPARSGETSILPDKIPPRPNIFRQAPVEYWGGGCPLTGIREAALLRASHIVPWAECETNALRLDLHNGLLLSALWDAAFDVCRFS